MYGYSASNLFINESGNNIQSKLLWQVATGQYRNLKCKLQKETAKACLSTNSDIKYNSNCLFSRENIFLHHLRDEGAWSKSPHCLSFTSISTGKTLRRWLKIMKSRLEGKETILHQRRQTLVTEIQIIPHQAIFASRVWVSYNIRKLYTSTTSIVQPKTKIAMFCKQKIPLQRDKYSINFI